MSTPVAPGTHRPSVSLIVPVHNGESVLRACLERLGELDPPPDECIVVDDGSSDLSRFIARAAGMRVISTGAPVGPARARNLGARHATGDVLLFVDADVLAPIDVVARVRELFAADPSLAAVIGSYDDAPAQDDFFSQYRNLLHHYMHQTGREEASTFWSGCGAIRREVFLRHGGFCACFVRPSVEDIELGARLRRAGEKIRLVKSLQAKHLKRWTFFSILRTDLFDRAVPWTRLILRQRRMPADLNLRWGQRVSTALSGARPPSPLPRRSLAAGAGLGSGRLRGCCRRPQRGVFYRFLADKRGLWFAVRAIPMHGLYFLCCAAGFAVGVFGYWLRPHPPNRES
jgi:GT2 family glycosyltransferase